MHFGFRVVVPLGGPKIVKIIILIEIFKLFRVKLDLELHTSKCKSSPPGDATLWWCVLVVAAGGAYTLIYTLLYCLGFAVPYPDNLRNSRKSQLL